MWKSKRDTSVVDCKFCGRKHERSRDKCPAFGKECTKCGKANHFSSLCKQRSVHPKRKKERVHHVQNPKSSDDDDDNDYCFTISLENQEEEEIVNKVDSQPIKSKISPRWKSKVTLFVKLTAVQHVTLSAQTTCLIDVKSSIPSKFWACLMVRKWPLSENVA